MEQWWEATAGAGAWLLALPSCPHSSSSSAAPFLPDSPNSLLERGYPEKVHLLSLRCMLSGLHAL